MKTPRSASSCGTARESWAKIEEIVQSADLNLLELITYKEALQYYARAFPKDLLAVFEQLPFPIRERVLIVLSSYARPQFLTVFPLYVSDVQELCHFMAESSRFRGKGRGIIRATREWLASRTVGVLEGQFIRQRKGVPGWPLQRVLHNTRPDPGLEKARRTLYRWGMGLDYTFPPIGLDQLRDYVRLETASETVACGIIARWGLPKEIIPPSLYAYNGVRRYYEVQTD